MLELRRLRYLVVLANSLNYSRAASELGLSQSALTRAIQSLEKEVGIRLFDRGQAGVRLTEQGRWMVEKASTLLIDASEFNRQVSEASQGVTGRVRFGMSSSAAHSLLAGTLGDRLERLHHFAHEIIIRDTERLSLMLAKGDLEFLVSEKWISNWSFPEGLSVKAESIAKLRIGLIVRADHPLTDLTQLDGQYPLMTHSAEEPWSTLATKITAQWSGAVQLVSEIGVATELTRSSNSIWLGSPDLVSPDIRSGVLRVLGLPKTLEEDTVEISLYRIGGRPISLAAQEIQEALRCISFCEQNVH